VSEQTRIKSLSQILHWCGKGDDAVMVRMQRIGSENAKAFDRAIMEAEGDTMTDKRCTAPPESIECTFSEPVEWEPGVPIWEYAVASLQEHETRDSLIFAKWLNRWGKGGWELLRLDVTGQYLPRAIFERRRRFEPEQGKCCECGCESEGEQC